jgi:hypothetical protein
MMSDPSMDSGKQRRRLSPSEKYQLFVEVLTGQATQREAAAKWGGGSFHGGAYLPDCETGCVGRAGRLGAGPGRHVSRAGGVGRGPGGDRPFAGHGHRAGGDLAFAAGKIGLGLSAGPVPTRVDAHVKAGLLQLLDHAVGHGWSFTHGLCTAGPR